MGKYYTKDHEWIEASEGGYRVGITRHAAEQLGDIVFVELPSIGADFKSGQDMAVVESVKAASDVYAPVPGKILAVNETLADAPELASSDPEDAGWFVLIAVEGDLPDTLMNDSQYGDFCEA